MGGLIKRCSGVCEVVVEVCSCKGVGFICSQVSIIVFQSVSSLLAGHVLSGISISIHCTVCVYTVCSQNLFNIDGIITVVHVSSQIF